MGFGTKFQIKFLRGFFLVFLFFLEGEAIVGVWSNYNGAMLGVLYNQKFTFRIGLYDTVEGKFYGNSGTGKFGDGQFA